MGSVERAREVFTLIFLPHLSLYDLPGKVFSQIDVAILRRCNINRHCVSSLCFNPEDVSVTAQAISSVRHSAYLLKLAGGRGCPAMPTKQ